VSLVEAQPFQGKKKGADGGIDGLKFFHDADKAGARKIVVSVKGGENVGLSMVKDLITTVTHNQAEIGLFITPAEPTQPMIAEAAKAGFCTNLTVGMPESAANANGVASNQPRVARPALPWVQWKMGQNLKGFHPPALRCRGFNPFQG
jgi:restriction endonuclease Mrr